VAFPAKTVARRRGFTLLELATVIVVIAILASMFLGGMGSMRARAERANCSANLRSLYGGASAYIQQQGQWPQIEVRLLQSDREEYARQWIAALKPYGLTQANWTCPTQHRILGSPDLAKHPRVDYNATPFDSRPRTPFTWTTQPWFVEHASVHDGGPLLIYSDGRVLSLSDVVRHR
jgi:prepilin-type N-terminal cleavage/methylation domain-containing protein